MSDNAVGARSLLKASSKFQIVLFLIHFHAGIILQSRCVVVGIGVDFSLYELYTIFVFALHLFGALTLIFGTHPFRLAAALYCVGWRLQFLCFAEACRMAVYNKFVYNKHSCHGHNYYGA